MANEMKLGLVLSATDKMSRVVDSATRKSQESLAKLERQSKNFAKTGAVGAVLAGGTAMATKSVLTAAGEVERYKAVLKTMLGTTELAEKRFKEMSDFAAATPFELQGVVQMGNQLQALGAYSKATMTDLGDLAAASGKPIDQVVGAFAKLKSGQKGEGVNMFRDLLITNEDWMRATGKGMSKNGELLASTSEMLAVLPKIMKEKKFSGMMDEMSKTYEGQISNMEDANSRMKASIGTLILPLAKQVIPKVTEFLAKIQAWQEKNPSLAVGILAVTAGLAGLLLAIAAIGFATIYIQKAIMAFKAFRAVMLLAKSSMLIFKVQYYALAAAQKVAAAGQWLLNAAITANPIVLIIVGIAALIAIVAVAWKKFAGFRAVIKTTWETIKGFGGILKDYVVDRIKGIISGLGSLGKAIGLLFKGKFSEATKEAKKGVKALSGYDAKMKAVTKTKALVSNVSTNYTQILKKEQEAQKKGTKTAGQAVPAMKSQATATQAQATTQNVGGAINYSPVINIASGSAQDKESFAQMLRNHKTELAKMMGEINTNNQRIAYQ